jgi:hypothetical protein
MPPSGLLSVINCFSSTPQGVFHRKSTGSGSENAQATGSSISSVDSVTPAPQDCVVSTSQNSTNYKLKYSINPLLPDSPTTTAKDSTNTMLQSSTIPSSQDSPIVLPQDSVIPPSQGSTLRSSPETTVPTFEESTPQISQVTELIQNIKRHVNDDNTAIIQASLDHILLQTTNLILHKQVYQQ